MARTFQSPLPLTVPLRTTGEEGWQLLDAAGAPIDLSGYELRMQVRDKRTGELLLDIASTGAEPYAAITPLDGLIEITVPADVVAGLSPDNRKLAARWDAEIYIPGASEYVVPLLRGSVAFTARVTQA